MLPLAESIKKTIAISEGYELGRLIYDNDKYLIELEGGKEINRDGLVIEILTCDGWVRLQEEDYKKFTEEGWPLVAGFDCKYKEDETEKSKANEKLGVNEMILYSCETELEKKLKATDLKELTVAELKSLAIDVITDYQTNVLQNQIIMGDVIIQITSELAGRCNEGGIE